MAERMFANDGKDQELEKALECSWTFRGKTIRFDRTYLLAFGGIVLLGFVCTLAGAFIIRSRDDYTHDRFDRLPTVVIPTMYQLEIRPLYEANISQFHFRVNISINVTSPSQYIILNAYMLDNLTASISGSLEQADIPISLPNDDVIRLTPLAVLSPGQYILGMEGDGFITDELSGLYKSRYHVQGTDYSHTLVTRLQNSYARRVFPCWDEPSFRAIFNLTLIIPKGQDCASNMPVHSVLEYEQDEQKQTNMVNFIPTPRLSPSMLGFSILGQLNNNTKSLIDDADIVHQAFFPAEMPGDGLLALKTSSESLFQMTIFLRSFYPLSKLDMISVTNLETGGLDDSLGMNMYNLPTMMVQDSDLPYQKMKAMGKICRQNARMWFGNVVAMESVSDAWVEEGMAIDLGSMVCSDIPFTPDKDGTTAMLMIDYLKAGKMLDIIRILPGPVQPLNAEDKADHFMCVNGLCGKAAAMAHMMKFLKGPVAYRNALSRLLNEYSFKNLKMSDFLDTMKSGGANRNIDIIDEYMRNEGFPFLMVEVNAEKVPVVITITQYTWTSQAYRWVIPITVSTSSGSDNMTVIVNGTTTEFVTTWPGQNSYIVNSCQSMYAVVQYKGMAKESLMTGIQDGQVSFLNRLTIEVDAFLGGHITGFNDYISLLEAYTRETEPLLWSDIAANINYINIILEAMGKNQTMNPVVNRIMGAMYRNLTWEMNDDEDVKITELRPIIMEIAGLYNSFDSAEAALGKFDLAIADPDKYMSHNMLRPIFVVGIRHGSNRQFDALHSFYVGASDPRQKLIALAAMGYTQHASSINRLLDTIALTDMVRIQDAVEPLTAIGMSQLVADVGYTYFTTHIRSIRRKFGDRLILSHFLAPLSHGFATFEMIASIQAVLKENQIPGNNSITEMIYRRIKFNQHQVTLQTNIDP